MRAGILLRGSVAVALLPTLIYIAWRRVARRTEWFFLRYVLLRKPGIALLLHKVVARTFRRQTAMVRVTGALYYRRGYGIGESPGETRTLYWEAPLTFTVWRDGKPLCGMALELRRNALCIRQLQGVAGVRFPEELRNWPRLFVLACVRFARLVGIKHVRLYRAHTSLFYEYPIIDADEGHPYEEAVRLHQVRMRRRYDGTARQLGFKIMEDWGEWTHPCR